MSLTKEQRLASFGTLLFLICFGGLLLLFSFKMPDPDPEEMGILVNFGDSDDGMGETEPKPMETNMQQQEESVQEPQPLQPSVTETGDNEEVNNQDFEEAAAIAAKKKADEKKKQDEELDRIKQQEIEKQKQEEIERQRIADEQRKRQEQEQAIKNKAANAFKGANINGGTSGEGETGKEGNQGKLTGDVNSKNRDGNGTGDKGISFKLEGRSFGSAPPKPEYKSNTEGKVVVEINVDRNGIVIDARPGVSGSTTTDKTLLEAAKAAALKTKFDSNTDATAVQKGTITYVFILQ